MVLKEFEIEGKTAIVTGAGRGIGKAIALTLAEAGADIVVAARTKQQIEQTAVEVQQLGRRSLAIPTDVGRTDQVEKMVKATIDQFGKIDILVANAGMGIDKPLVPVNEQPQMTEQDWDTTINIDLNGVVRCARAVGPQMIEQRRGKIINISSVDGIRGGSTYSTAYVTAKAAVNRFTRALALEWAPFNINVNTIAPGCFLTEIWGLTDSNFAREKIDAVIESVRSLIPLGRWGDLRELGLLAVFLASDASNYMTGEVISCDGGLII